MKRRRNVLAVLMGAMLLVSAAGCGDSGNTETNGGNASAKEEKEEEIDAKQVFEDCTAKNNELKNMDIDYSMQMTLTQGEESMNMNIDMDMTAIGLDGDALQYALTTTTAAAGQEMTTDMYYTEGYYYMDVSGQKIKYATDVSEVIEQVESSTGTSGMDANSMKSLEAEKDGDNIILTFEADPSQMSDYVNNTLRSMESLVDTSQISIDEVSGTYTVNPEGYCTNTVLNMVMSISMDGTEVAMDMSVDADITPLEDGATVTFPEDLADYVEVDASQLQ